MTTALSSRPIDSIEKKVDGRGGARKGAGLPKGTILKKTLVKQIEIQYIKDRVSKARDALINAQLSLATGVSYLYKIEKDSKGHNKKPEMVKAQGEIEAYLAGETDDEVYYYIHTDKPENMAIDSLLNRTVGKAPDTVKHEGVIGIVGLIAQIESKNKQHENSDEGN